MGWTHKTTQDLTATSCRQPSNPDKMDQECCETPPPRAGQVPTAKRASARHSVTLRVSRHQSKTFCARPTGLSCNLYDIAER